ncbi:cdc42 effector protein 1 [Chelonoidis abingdonii]|uniref:cdc42 effector protein 1 n=1 Tax=Chelonoidis abingdonii TaxID=106734 RepID=UPI0013F29B17|nr:cdc42 effector protein 1 [Chelonoidis abingdonii]XP_032635061.1 cdc42 effector protein 1 [Chelonoidis abingdonii]
MSLGKLPVLGWVSGSHGKRRLKSELTPDMISPPLGDFRHTMHVGRGGDVFGDTSFLSNHGGTETAKANNFFARTLRHMRRTPLRNRGSGNKAEASPAPPDISPIIKNAVSLPQLNEGTYGSSSPAGKFAFKSAPNNVSETHYAYGLESGFCTIPRAPRSEKARESSFPAEAELQRSDSLLSFRLDLGPSLMSELLQVISFTEAMDSSDKREDARALAGGQAASPLALHGEWVEAGVPRGSGTPNARYIEGDMAESLWGHSRQGTSTPLGHLVHANGDAHALQHAEEGPAYAGSGHQSLAWGSAPAEELGALPKDSLWQGHWNDCSMEAGEFHQAAQVLAHHYSARGAHGSLEEEEEGPRESPAVSSWQADEARWSHSEEEEEEAALSAVREGEATAGEGRSNSFEYADEEEEDDEVKV